MFEIIGYWGTLSLFLMSPIVLAFWAFMCFTNHRVEQLGGTKIGLFKLIDEALCKAHIGAPLVIGTIICMIMSIMYWVCGFHNEYTYINYHSAFAEWMSPASGFVISAVLAVIVYDLALKAYVRVNKLVSKLETME